MENKKEKIKLKKIKFRKGDIRCPNGVFEMFDGKKWVKIKEPKKTKAWGIIDKKTGKVSFSVGRNAFEIYKDKRDAENLSYSYEKVRRIEIKQLK